MLGEIRFFAATLLVLLPLGHSASATVGFKPAQSYAVGTAPEMAAVADFNNDGKPDIAVVSFGDPSVGDDGGVSILLGNGDGTFQPATKLTAGKNPTRIATGDFNSDGKSDLLVVRAGDASVSDNGDATIFLGNGDGTFSPGQVLVPGKNPSAVALSDLNVDHKLDLIFGNSTDNSVTVLLGNGDGSFQSPVAYAVAVGGSPSSISLTDVNQDGRSDLAVFWGLSVDFFFGNGDGTFQTGPSLVAGTLRFFSTIGDFNQDGKIDLVDHGCEFLHPNNCSTSIRLGNGDGTFQTPNAIPGFSGAAAVAADVNGDGILDLVGASSDHTQLAVLVGNGDGTFQEALTFAAGTNPFIGLVADFDGDKAPDLVAINSDAAISVLLNTGTDFSISAPPLSPSSVSAGQTATSTMSLNLLNAFDNPVSLACAVTPVQAGSPTCSLSSNSVTFDPAGKASATLTVTAGSAVASLLGPHPYVQDSLPFRFIWLPAAGFTFMGIGLSWRSSQKKNLLNFLVGAIVVAVLIPLVACGGGSRSAPPVSYAITIRAMSGSTQHSTAVTLTVQ
jgi:hypothetical protein